MAKKNKTEAKATESEETTTAADGDDAGSLDKILNPDSVRPNVQAFVDWVQEQGGPKINAKHAQAVITGYKRFQRSDAAKSAREAAAAEKVEAKEARAAARAKKAEETAKAKAERAEAKETRDKAAAEKKAANKKSPAAASKPAKKAAASAGKATAKKAATKKGKGAKAPY